MFDDQVSLLVHEQLLTDPLILVYADIYGNAYFIDAVLFPRQSQGSAVINDLKSHQWWVAS